MHRIFLIIGLLVLLSGCGGHDPIWRMKAELTLLQLQQDQAGVSHPDDYASVANAFRQGEQLLVAQGDGESADQLFVLAYQKGMLLKQELARYKEQLKEETLQREIEALAIREEEERSRLEAEHRRQKELAEAQKELQKSLNKPEPGTSTNGVPQPTTYTVRRGETLPQIAARPEIYGDTALWPLIYRANRDQIRDPYQLWPGQQLRIPRSFSREDALDARRQAHRRSR